MVRDIGNNLIILIIFMIPIVMSKLLTMAILLMANTVNIMITIGCYYVNIKKIAQRNYSQTCE